MTEGADDGDDEVRGREVVVPLALYKRVTVFGTLIAVVFVLIGFLLFDAATIESSPLRRLVVGSFEAVGITPDPGLLSIAFGLLGVGSILVGAANYVFATRFRTAEMGNAKDAADEGSNDG